MSTTDNKTIDTETMLKEADFMVIDLMEDAISMFLSFALAYSEEDIKIYGFYVSPAYNRLNCQISNLIGKDESGRKIREFMDTKVKCVLPSYIIDFDSIPDLEKLFTVKELETIHNDETPASLIKIVKRKTKTFFSQWTYTKDGTKIGLNTKTPAILIKMNIEKKSTKSKKLNDLMVFLLAEMQIYLI